MSLIQASRMWEDRSAAGAGTRSRLALLAGLAVAFTASAWATTEWSLDMAGMGGSPMAGGWMMSMMWLPICGQSWPGLAASFLAMWLLMMAAMMLPSLSPVLWRYHEALIGMRHAHPGRLVASIGLGYLSVWALIGCIVFVSGAAFATMAAKLPALARAAPFLAGLVVALAGAWQFSPWKAHRLICWLGPAKAGFERPKSLLEASLLEAPLLEASLLEVPLLEALREGLRLGAGCSVNCAGLTAILPATGLMDLRAMAAITAATLVERLAPDGVLAARVTGSAIIGCALILLARAAGLI